MDVIMILVAFVFGFLVKQVGLPPLLGFLAAGFVLNGFGVEGGEDLQRVADIWTDWPTMLYISVPDYH